uniref:Inhibitor of Bruton agammaglobulinemia tyrosine kinase n=1 Tax=Cyprinus carpio TaxID=7962 RepID=A0A8C1LC62_CYPCA
MSLGSPDCTPKCRSERHAEEVIAALTSGSEGSLQGFLSVHCHNAATLRDEFGRTALHLVASLGKRDLLQWLLDRKHADMLAKDKESGWTALHRSAFYGQIHCLMGLIKRGGALSIQDKEGLSALDLTMKDRPAHVVFRNTDPTEVYTWGSNTNFSLGHGNQESRHHPEIVDLFSRSRIYVKQVVLCKFHSVFLSQKGQVYTCGHGQGGRLGHGDEQTYLVPRMVEGLLSHHCSQIAAARDHTVVLTEEGYVYTFGLNTHHQLGLAPPPASSQVPKQVTSKSLKGRSVIGVAAGRFHTVLWTRDAVYTVGLNGGQLDCLTDLKSLRCLPNGEKCVTVPRQVSALHHKDVTIAMAAASNGATVCVTEKGDVYLLTDYQCKKLASKQLNLKKVLVSGGSLDHRIDPQLLHDGGGEKLVILALDEAGRVFCWRSVGTSVRPCRWAYSRQVFMSDIALSKNSMMFVTQDGEGFSGQWLGQYKKAVDKKGTESINGMEVSGHSDGGGVYERIRLEKLPYVHRAVSITMDSKGRNFGVLQSDPKTRLDGVKFENGKISVVQKKTGNKLRFNQKKCSYLCDVTLRSEDGKEFPCHKCVLCARLEYFNSMLGSPWIEATSCTALDMATSSEVLQAILEYIYTDESPTVRESVNVEFVCNVLVVADQLLITRLKEICEVAITENLTLKNAAELLEFATVYNADQLKLSCLQFIVLNMAALLESRALEILSDGVLLDLTAAYRRMIPAMQRRLITPYADAPDLSAYEDRDPLCVQSSESLLKKAKMRAKRKPRRRSDSSGGYNLSDVIRSSSSLAHSAKASSVESLPELITSDSEGSYMGAGSPRDLQSPVLHDRPEAQVKPQHLCLFTVHCCFFLLCPMLIALMNTSSSSSTKVSGLPSKMSQKQRKMMALASREGSTEKPYSIMPWVLRAVGSPPSTSTFASIVEEERQQEAALIRSREKPLALIQIEERAIQDLLLHYEAINNPEELILVERSTLGPIAIPTWNKH